MVLASRILGIRVMDPARRTMPPGAARMPSENHPPMPALDRSSFPSLPLLPLRPAVCSAVAGLAAVLALVGLAPAAQALSITFGLNHEFSGGTAPEGTAPWVEVTVDDSFGGANTVRLTISNSGLIGSENVMGAYLNFDPSLDPTLLSFSVVDNSDSVPNAINTGVDAFQADGDGVFDIEFDMPPAPGNEAALFTAGESIVYDVTYVSPITASSFDYPSVMGGGNGAYQAAAHIQRIGLASESGWIGPVPEPSTGLLLGIGLIAATRRRTRS